MIIGTVLVVVPFLMVLNFGIDVKGGGIRIPH